MKLSELKNWINGLPDKFLDFEVVNGEEGKLDDQYWYRIDKPVVSLMIDEESGEVIILNDTDKPLTTDDIEDGMDKV